MLKAVRVSPAKLRVRDTRRCCDGVVEVANLVPCEWYREKVLYEEKKREHAYP